MFINFNFPIINFFFFDWNSDYIIFYLFYFSDEDSPNFEFVDVSDDTEETHVCERCWKHFKHRNTFYRHLQNCIEPDRRYPCPYCEYRATQRQHLQDHIQCRHLRPKGAVGEHQCPRCKRRYHHKHHLISHLRNECGVEPKFQCPYCAFRSKLKGNLTKHVKRLHSNFVEEYLNQM